MKHVKVVQQTINCNGILLDLSMPRVMGILNVTPDSFYAASRVQNATSLLIMAEEHLANGAAILDIGALSTRPHAQEIPIDQECELITWAVETVKKQYPKALISVDTYRASVARAALELGVHMINDVGGGTFDDSMLQLVGAYDVPYVLMHNRAKADKMTAHTDYEDLIKEMLEFFYRQEYEASRAGIKDVILDPGIGFSKTIAQNFILIQRISEFNILGKPQLVGLSRKSFIYKTLETTAAGALNGTIAMHMVALQEGAKILRAHDVKEAIQCVKLYNAMCRVRHFKK